MKIKNINGTSANKCSCDSWLAHWKSFSRQTIIYCCEKGCTSKELVGAHVQKADGYDSNWYILPLCNAHNQSANELEVSDIYNLVSANKAETCEKPKTYRVYGL